MEQRLFEILAVYASLAIIVMTNRRLNGLPAWDSKDRADFELQCHKDKLTWELDRSHLRDGLIVLLIRGFFYPLYYYHKYVYFWFLSGCGYAAWLIEKPSWKEPDSISGDVRFKVAVDIYNIGWSTFLTFWYAVAFVFVPEPCERMSWFAILMEGIAGLFALARLYEILGVTVRLHFKESYVTRSTVRAFVNTLWHYAFMSVIFSVFYLNVAAFARDTYGDVPLTTDWISPLYFSVITMLTIGYGDFHPVTWAGKGVVCFEVFVGILLIILVVARLVSMMSSPSKKGH